jgi:hypothetical protein
LDTKIVYDIHIKQVRIIQQQNGLLFPWTQEKVFLIIDRIEKNTLETLNVEMAYFSLKLDNDGYVITISYTGLPDFLGVFGSFFATFTLFASLITSNYSGLIYNQTMINQIFRFVEEKCYQKGKENEKQKEKVNVNVKEKDNDNEEALADGYEMHLNAFKFKSFENLSVGQISDFYRKSVVEENYGAKIDYIKNNSKNQMNNSSNQISQIHGTKPFGKTINAINKSFNSNLYFLHRNKFDEKSEIIQQKEKSKYLRKDIELEVINANKGIFILLKIEGNFYLIMNLIFNFILN